MNIVNEYLPAGFYTAGNLNPTFDWEKQSIAVYDKYAILFGMIAMMYLPTVFGLKQCFGCGVNKVSGLLGTPIMQ